MHWHTYLSMLVHENAVEMEREHLPIGGEAEGLLAMQLGTGLKQNVLLAKLYR